MKRPYTLKDHNIIMLLVGSEPVREIAQKINRTPKSVYCYLIRQGVKRLKRYTELENYLLSEFRVPVVAPYIKGRTINALKIKRSRSKCKSA